MTIKSVSKTVKQKAFTPEATTKLEINEVVDQYVRSNFERLRDFMTKESPLKGFRAFEVTFIIPEANFTLKHGLGFQPKDIIQTSITGAGVIVYNYDSFTANELDITCTGAVTPTSPTTVRFLVGSLEIPE